MLSAQDLTRCRIKITYLQISRVETLFGLYFEKKKKKKRNLIIQTRLHLNMMI